MIEQEERRLLRPADLAARMGLTTGRIYQMIKAGQIPHVVSGKRSILIPSWVWEAYMEEQGREALRSVGGERHAG